MVETCITPTPLPITDIWPAVSDLIITFSDMYSIPSIVRQGILPFPPFPAFPVLPNMPTVPSIDLQLPTMSMPSLEGVLTAAGIQSGQIFILIDFLIAGLTEFIPAIPLPTMPGLTATLADLLTFDPASLLVDIRDIAFDFSLIGNLPPLWPTVDIPDISSLQALQFSAEGMMQLLTGSLLTLIANFQSYLDDLELSYGALPTLPVIPTISELMALLPPIPTLADIPLLLVPGFPSLVFPNPLRPDGIFSDFDVATGIQCIYQDMNMFIIKTLSDYIESLPVVGPFITGNFPTVGDLIGPFSIGEICYDIPPL